MEPIKVNISQKDINDLRDFHGIDAEQAITDMIAEYQKDSETGTNVEIVKPQEPDQVRDGIRKSLRANIEYI